MCVCVRAHEFMKECISHIMLDSAGSLSQLGRSLSLQLVLLQFTRVVTGLDSHGSTLQHNKHWRKGKPKG